MFQFAFLLAVSGAFAAPDPCRTAKVEVDPFSGAEKVTVGATWVRAYASLVWEARREGGENWWSPLVSTNGVVDVVLPSGWGFEMKLADGSLHAPRTQVDTVPSKQASAYGGFTSWMPQLLLTDDDLRALASSDITFMRYDVGKGPVTLSVTNKGAAKRMREAFSCLLTKRTST